MATDVAKTLRSIEARKGKVVLAEDWATIHKALAEVGPTVSLIILNGGKPTGPVPPANPASPDMTAPLVATGVTPVQISPTRVDITCDPGYDPLVSGFASGMRRSQLYRSVNGGAAVAFGSPVLSGGLGLSVELTWIDIGGVTGTHSGTSPNYTLGTNNGSIYDTPISGTFGSATVTGNFTLIFNLTSFTGDGFATLKAFFGDTLTTGMHHVGGTEFPPSSGNGENLEWNTTGSGEQAARLPGNASPRYVKLRRVGNQFTMYGGSGGLWTQLSQQTISTSLAGFAGLAIAKNGSSTNPSATVTQLALQQLADPSWSDTTVTVGNTYAYTVVHEDMANFPATGNLSTPNTPVSITVVSDTVSAEPYPRMGIFTLGQYNYGSNVQRRDVMSRFGAAWVYMYAGCHLDPVYGGGFGSCAAIWADIKARSTARGGWFATRPTQIYNYWILEAFYKSIADGGPGYESFVGQLSTVAANNLYTRQSYPSGNRINSWYGPNEWAGPVASIRPAVGGLPYSSWVAQQICLQISVGGTQVGGPPNIDGDVMDNDFTQGRISDYLGILADYDEDGIPETDAQGAQVYRNGEQRGLDYMRNYPGRGNKAVGGNSSWSSPPSPFNQQRDIILFEAAIGEPWSDESNNTWLSMMGNAQAKINALRPGGVQEMWFCGKVTGDGSGVYTANSALTRQALYIYCSGFMFDMTRVCISDLSTGDYAASPGCWMDFFVSGLLGAPIDAAGYLTPYQNGVRRRRFANGSIFVNPKGNGTPTITFGTTLKAPTGQGASNLTPGASYTGYTFPSDRCGLLMLNP